MKPKIHASSLPPTGPGSSYLHPHICDDLQLAVDIARNRGGPVMAQVTDAGVIRVMKVFENGQMEVAP